MLILILNEKILILNEKILRLLELMTNFLILSCSLFMIGLCGLFLSHKNLIVIILSLELLLLASLVNISLFSLAHDDLTGQLMSLLILTIGATESSIGLGLVILFFRLNNSVSVSVLTKLQA